MKVWCCSFEIAVEVARSLIFGAERIISEIQLKAGGASLTGGAGWKSLNFQKVAQIHTNFSHLSFAYLNKYILGREYAPSSEMIVG